MCQQDKKYLRADNQKANRRDQRQHLILNTLGYYPAQKH